VSRWEDELLDAFLADLPEDGVDALVAAVEGEGVAPPALRADLLREARLEGRFHRFAARVADLLDVSEETARALLDGIGRAESWGDGGVPGVDLYHVEGGPAVANAITGFVRMSAGADFPEHTHLGDEVVLVIQGSFQDGASGRVHRAGEAVHMPEGTAHGFRVRPGPALVYLVVLQEGLKIGDMVRRADDPDM
jgi:putative transcriptional regulator